MKMARTILLLNGIPRATMAGRVSFPKISKLICSKLSPASNENIPYFAIEKL